MKDTRINTKHAQSFAPDMRGLVKPVTNKNHRNMLGLGKMSHLGKMSGIDSFNGGLIDTDGNFINKHCESHIVNGGDDCICHDCYACTMAVNGHTSVEKGMENYRIINSEFWMFSKVPAIMSDLEKGKNTEFRFNAVDDIDTAIGLINYLMICEKSWIAGSDTCFALWTKNNDILDTVFNKLRVHKPENLNILISSDRVNHVAVIPENAWYIDGVFTVWSDTASCEAAGQTMNCCNENKKRVCHTCEHSCYHMDCTDGIQYRNELLRRQEAQNELI